MVNVEENLEKRLDVIMDKYFVEDLDIDKSSQLKKLVKVMTYEMPRSMLNKDTIDIIESYVDTSLLMISAFFPSLKFENLINATYDNNQDIYNDLFVNTCNVSNNKGKEISNKISKFVSEEVDRQKEESRLAGKEIIVEKKDIQRIVLSEAAVYLIYDPVSFSVIYMKNTSLEKEVNKVMSKYTNTNRNSESTKRELYREIQGISEIKDLQTQFLSILNQRNEEYSLIASQFDFNTLGNKEFMRYIVPNLFFKVTDEIKSKGDINVFSEIIGSRFAFACLTHFVGYSEKPHSHKHDIIQNLFYKKGKRFVLEDELFFGEGSYAMEDAYGQLEITSGVLTAYMLALADTNSNLDELKESLKKVVPKNKYDKIVREYKDFRIQAKKVNKKERDDIRLELEKNIRRALESEYDGLTSRIERIEKKNIQHKEQETYLRIKYIQDLELIAERDSKISSANIEIQSLRSQLRQAEYDVIVATQEPKYHVKITGRAHSKQYKKGYKSKVEFASQVLSRNSDAGEKITITENTYLFDKLKFRFPRFNNFYKLRSENHHRLIYSRDGDNVHILDVIPHSEYSKLSGQKN